MQEMLDKFENKKIILTNANEEEKEKFGLKNLPYELFTLEHNPNKPDSKYYEIFLEKYDLNPEDVVYFEHNLDAVKSAQSV
jgi:HAD superfamily hydrolase (TIGR01509 family)